MRRTPNWAPAWKSPHGRAAPSILESALFAEADCVVATGSDETLAAIRQKLPPAARFVGYGTQVSFGYVTREALERHAHAVAEQAAADVTAWNQRGCLSPHVIYVEDSGSGTGEDFAELLAGKLEALEKTHPRGALSAGRRRPSRAGAPFTKCAPPIRRRPRCGPAANRPPGRSFWKTTRAFSFPARTGSFMSRWCRDLTQALQGAESVREKISTVGLACSASANARSGADASRIGAPGESVRWARCKIRRWAGATTAGRRWAIW